MKKKDEEEDKEIDRQTDTQTNKQTDKHAASHYRSFTLCVIAAKLMIGSYTLFTPYSVGSKNLRGLDIEGLALNLFLFLYVSGFHNNNELLWGQLHL